MLPDEEVDKIRSECSHTNGHINYRKFAREIERAVLAKSISQQERLYKEWSELWSPIDDAVRPLTPLGEGVAAKALELINLAKAMPMPKQEPVKEESRIYDARLACDRVMLLVPVGYKLYVSPPPAQAAAIPEGWQLVPVEPTPEMLNEICLVHNFSDTALTVRYKAMLSASPKPE